ncbi:MAG TPA: hypothetical protein VKV03_17220, partial [Candidatus Binataceae bacterium]|nr:hypothetical protein [Candidatus Binataceae bacterium]
MRNRGTSILIAGALALAIIAHTGVIALAQSSNPAPVNATAPQVPQPDEGGVNWQGVGYGAGTLATNIFYIPAKLVYAILGGLVGGGAWCLTGGNTQTANTIWRSSLGGDYVVTPDMLAGKEPIHFSGPTDTAPVPADSTVQPITSAPPSAPLPSTSTNTAPASAGGTGAGAQPMDRGAGSVGHPGAP